MVAPSQWRRATGLTAIGTLVALFAYDLVAFVFGGNPSTFSRVLGDAGQTHPMLLVSAGAMLGAFVVHVFGLRQTTPPDAK